MPIEKIRPGAPEYVRVAAIHRALREDAEEDPEEDS